MGNARGSGDSSVTSWSKWIRRSKCSESKMHFTLHVCGCIYILQALGYELGRPLKDYLCSELSRINKNIETIFRYVFAFCRCSFIHSLLARRSNTILFWCCMMQRSCSMLWFALKTTCLILRKCVLCIG